jgi:hypothetical protein
MYLGRKQCMTDLLYCMMQFLFVSKQVFVSYHFLTNIYVSGKKFTVTRIKNGEFNTFFSHYIVSKRSLYSISRTG